MKYNLATCEYELIHDGYLYLRFNRDLLIFVGFEASSIDPVIRCHFEFVVPADHRQDVAVTLERIPLDLAYENPDNWTREAIIFHLLTHHADELARYEVGHSIEAEDVELPNEFMEAE